MAAEVPVEPGGGEDGEGSPPAPSPAQELEEIRKLQAEDGPSRGCLKAGANYYLVSHQWLNAWWHWVGHPSALDSAGEAAPSSHRRDEVFTEVADAVFMRTRPTERPTERPGPISNHSLLEGSDQSGRLRRETLECRDFEVVSTGVWERLHGWYGGGPAICREAVRSAGEVQVEIHRLSVKARRSSNPWSAVDIECSRAETVAGLVDRLCEEFGLESEDVRLLRHRGGVHFDLIESSTFRTLEDCGILSDQILELDERNADGTWQHSASDLVGRSDVSGPCKAEPETSEANTSGQPESETCEVNSVGRPGGQLGSRTAGIRNLGNTCFMGSSLQCLANVPELRDYFLSNRYQEALKAPGQPSEGANGKLAEGFAALLNRMWRKDPSAVSPSAFKELIERTADRFSGYRQHDAMEFVEFLIDGLKEDCNRIKGKKPYVERADADGRSDAAVALEAANGFLLRNDSVVDDFFVGFQKSTTTCPECRRESTVFDPFLSIKVPVTNARESQEMFFVLTVVPLASSGRPITRQRVAVSRAGSICDLVRAAARASDLGEQRSILAEVFDGRVYTLYEDSERLEEITTSDTLILYELEDVPAFRSRRRWASGEALKEGDVVVTAANFKSNSERPKQLRQGLTGKVVQVDHEGDALVKFDTIVPRQWVFRRNLVNLISALNADPEETRTCPDDSKEYKFRELVQHWDDQYSLEDLTAYWRDVMRPVGEVREDVSLCAAMVHFRSGPADRHLVGVPLVFCIHRDSTPVQVAVAVRKELEQRFGPEWGTGWRLYQADRSWEMAKSDRVLWDREEPQENAIWLREREYLAVEWEEEPPARVSRTLEEAALRSGESRETRLEQCFEWLTEEEQLSEHDAVYCSKCKEHRQVFRKVEFWSLPPVLVLQLKRFEFNTQNRRRLATPVHFPLEGLDLKRFCLSETPSFPEGKCLRAGQRVVIRGLQSATGKALNGAEGVAMYLDTGSARFCVRLQEGDPATEWKRVKPANLEPPPAATLAKPSTHAATFDLLALSKHVGGTSFGHYVAYARSSEDGVWRLFDDDEVQDVQASDVEAEVSGAYVLFYLRRDCRPQAWGPARTPRSVWSH